MKENIIHPHHTQSKKIIPIVFLVAIILGLAVYWLGNKKSVYIYKTLDSYTLKGPTKNEDITFTKPIEYKQDKEGQEQHRVSFTHLRNNKGINVYYGTLSLFYVPYNKDLNSSFYNVYMLTIKDINSPELEGLKEFTKANLFAPKYNVVFTKETYYRSKNIPGRAWLVDFNAKSSVNSSRNFRGQALMLGGKRGMYYLAFDNLNYNWSKNSKTWDKILSSVKIVQ